MNNNDKSVVSCKMICGNNVVSSEKLQEVRQEVLSHLRDCLINTYGPMGSSTAIMKGNDNQTTYIEYSKDGRKVLKNILYGKPIEACIKSEIEEIVAYVDGKVGDATTSAIILSSFIAEGLYKILNENKIPPRMLINKFQSIVEEIKESIIENANPITLDAIYDISMISTNGNKKISSMIKNIYEEYGYDVNINVDISNDKDTKLKSYDGLSIDEGYSDHCYINNISKGIVEIHNANVYTFIDPINTKEMISFLETIIYDNILNHVEDGEFIPTVIMAPKITRDATIINLLAEYLHGFDNFADKKPPILIISNISGEDQEISTDISTLCGGKLIKKYIDPEIQKKDQETGLAPTLETIHNFAGSCELVSANSTHTKFINPKEMVNNKTVYENLLNYLKSEIKNLESNNEDSLSIGRVKKRLKSLESNMVDLLVGGISISDRDDTKDLVEDAVKNCSSATIYGYGRGANYEGYSVAKKLYAEERKKENSLRKYIIDIIDYSYTEALRILYKSITNDKDTLDILIQYSHAVDSPINIAELVNYSSNINEDIIKCFIINNIRKTNKKKIYKNNVICSIQTDIEVLNAISKIISLMATSNQCLLQSTALNQY